MSDYIEIQKCNKDHSNHPCWVPCENTNGEKVRPLIYCNCGVLLNCDAHHIHPDGRLTNSFYHKETLEGYPNGCGWHVHIKMKDWTGEEFIPQTDAPSI
jgi:hypothetical protein